MNQFTSNKDNSRAVYGSRSVCRAYNESLHIYGQLGLSVHTETCSKGKYWEVERSKLMVICKRVE